MTASFYALQRTLRASKKLVLGGHLSYSDFFVCPARHHLFWAGQGNSATRTFILASWVLAILGRIGQLGHRTFILASWTLVIPGRTGLDRAIAPPELLN